VQAWASFGAAGTAFARAAFAALALAGVAWRGTTDRTTIRQEACWLAAGGIGLAGFQYCYFEAVPAVGVSVSTVIAIGLAPTFTGAAAWLTSARPSTPWLLGTWFSMIGLAMMLLGPVELSGRLLAGIAWSTLAAGLFSLQIIAIERSTRTGWPHAAALAWMFAVAALVLAPLGLPEIGARWPVGLGDLTLALYLGFITAGLAYWLFAAGTKRIGGPMAATISVLEPATAALLAVVFLGERQSGIQWFGMLLLVGSVVATATLSSGRASPHTAGGDADGREAEPERTSQRIADG
jgi:DME family drug/metabolite transporter